MKKFFRTLALVLALTLVIGTIPAAAADEVKPLTKKTLYIGGAQGTNADGKQSTYKAKVALYKLAGYKTKADAEGVAISAVAADEKVRVTKSYVYAEELGKTNVTLTVDGVDYTVPVTVKKNAEAVKVVGLEEGEVVVGTTVEFSLPRKGSDTDARRVTVNGTALDDIEGKDRCYSYKFDKAGEYEFVLEAFQSKYYPVATAKEIVKVTVVEPTVVSAKQVASNKVAVTFDCDVTNAITKASFVENCVYNKIVDLEITAGLIKDVKIEKEVATVELYQSFAENTEYFVKVAGQEASFKTAENKIENVDKITVDVATAYAGDNAEITVKYFNADGVELVLANKANITVESDYGWYEEKSGKPTLYMYEANQSATVKATLDIGYDPDTYVLISKSDAKTVVSVEKAKATITSKIFSFDDVTKTETHTIRIDDDAKYISVKTVDSDKKESTVTYKKADGYTITSSNEKIAMVDGNGAIFGVTEGTTVIIVSKDNKTVDAFQISVVSKNKAASATIEVSKNKVNLADDLGFADEATLSIKVLDLNGNEVTDASDTKLGYSFTVKQVDNNAAATGYTLDAGSTTFGAVSIHESAYSGTRPNPANIKFTVTVKNKSEEVIASKDIVVAVGTYKAASEGALTYTYTVKASKNALDSSLTFNATPGKLYADAKVSVEKTYNGFTIGVADFIPVSKITDIPSTSAVTGTSFNYIVWEIPEKAVAGLVATEPGIVTGLKAITVKNLGSAMQQVAGSYKATGYRVSYDAAGKLSGRQPIGSQIITVTTNDSPVTFSVYADKRDAANAKSGAAFELAWAGRNSKDNASDVSVVNVDYEEDSTTGNVYVRKLIVKIDANVYGVKNTVEVPVNELFYVK